MSIATPTSDIRKGKPARSVFPALDRQPVYLVLDSLKCAHNIGCIFRIADALRIQKVFLCGDTILPPNKKIWFGSRGAERWVPWEYCESAAYAVLGLRARGVQIVAAEISNESIPFTQLTPSRSFCLVVGREQDGVSAEVLALCDVTVDLPMNGMSNSLNVSVTAGVLLYTYAGKQLNP